jgi:hypothetical protein
MSKADREEQARADQAKLDFVSQAGYVGLEEMARRKEAAWEAGIGLASLRVSKFKPREKRIVSLGTSKK